MSTDRHVDLLEHRLGVNKVDTHEMDELHEKDRSRGTRMKRSEKARGNRHIIKGKLEREHERGYRGDI